MQIDLVSYDDLMKMENLSRISSGSNHQLVKAHFQLQMNIIHHHVDHADDDDADDHDDDHHNVVDDEADDEIDRFASLDRLPDMIADEGVPSDFVFTFFIIFILSFYLGILKNLLYHRNLQNLFIIGILINFFIIGILIKKIIIGILINFNP